MDKSELIFRCPFCEAAIFFDEIDLEDDFYDLIPRIAEADRFIECSDCQCEILYNSKTFKIVLFGK